MVIGGWPQPSFGKVELINLNEDNVTCPLIKDCPLSHGSVGTFINDKPLVCGGYENQTQQYSSECYSYHTMVFLRQTQYYQ